MKTTEKISTLYLRLNGFFTMPYFTTFTEGEKHLDILAIRQKGCREDINGTVLIIDDDFVKQLGGVDADIALISEVGPGGRDIGALFPERKIAYCSKIFGKIDNIHKAYFDISSLGQDFEKINDIVVIPIGRCREFILSRFSQMESKEVKSKMKTSKIGSWNWSEEFLGDLLFLKKIGFLKD